mmetsp:Transcript_9449/g.38624  ORF Transcript_9449/g.38624 Transcript_9449/m.38624 type:complete len:285 (+) Transcript_9449:587-1441(+)
MARPFVWVVRCPDLLLAWTSNFADPLAEPRVNEISRLLGVMAAPRPTADVRPSGCSPGDATPRLAPGALRLLRASGHVAREFDPKRRRVLGAQRRRPAVFVPFVLPALELRRVLAEARAAADAAATPASPRGFHDTYSMPCSTRSTILPRAASSTMPTSRRPSSGTRRSTRRRRRMMLLLLLPPPRHHHHHRPSVGSRRFRRAFSPRASPRTPRLRPSPSTATRPTSPTSRRRCSGSAGSSSSPRSPSSRRRSLMARLRQGRRERRRPLGRRALLAAPRWWPAV